MNKTLYSALLLGLLLIACRDDKKEPAPVQADAPAPAETHNTLTAAEKAAGWTLLFDGESLDGWHLYNKPGDQPIWEVQDGALVCDPLNGKGEHGDLVTDGVYENFELTFDWDIPETGNSGVFINVQEDPAHRATYSTGPEYQLLGEQHLDFEIENKRSGCLYGYAAQLNEANTNPPGEWNHSRIIQQDGKVEFYLNGNLTARTDFNASQWKDWVATSGFKDNPEFAKKTSGHIGLQLWTSSIRFRNMKIREL